MCDNTAAVESLVSETNTNVETSTTMALKGLKDAYKIAYAAYSKAESAHKDMRAALRTSNFDSPHPIYAACDKLYNAAINAENKQSRLKNFIDQLEESQRLETLKAKEAAAMAGIVTKIVICKKCRTVLPGVNFGDALDLEVGKTVEVELYCHGCKAEISTAIIAPRVTA